jgi:MFS family permease
MLNVVVICCTLAYFAKVFGTSCFFALLPFLATPQQVGILLCIQGCFTAILTPPSGLAVNRYGAKYVLYWGFVACSAGVVFTVISSSFAMLLIGRLFWWTGDACFNVATFAFMMDHFEEPERTKYIGIVLGVSNMAGLVAPPIAGYLFDYGQEIGLQQPQLLSFAPVTLFMACAFVALAFLPEPLVEKTPGQKEEASLEPVTFAGSFQSVFAVFTAGGSKTLVLAAVMVCLFGAQRALLATGVIQLKATHHSAHIVGWVLVPPSILQSLGGIAGGSLWSTPKRRFSLVALLPLMFAASLACMSFLPLGLVPMVILTLGLGCLAIALIEPPAMSIMAEFAQEHGLQSGSAMIASEVAIQTGFCLSPLGVAILRESSFQGVCLSCAVGAAAMGFVAARTFHKEMGRQDSSTSEISAETDDNIVTPPVSPQLK